MNSPSSKPQAKFCRFPRQLSYRAGFGTAPFPLLKISFAGSSLRIRNKDLPDGRRDPKLNPFLKDDLKFGIHRMSIGVNNKTIPRP
jgi:hypothetical protein